MNYTFNAEDIKLIRKFEEIKNRGYYASGNEVTAVYNRVFGTSLSSTSCGSCLRGRIQQMVDALNNFEKLSKRQEELKAQEALKDAQVNNSSSDENKPIVEEKRRVGRPKK